MVTRRVFLKGSALTVFGFGAAPAWLSRSLCASEGARGKKILVAIFQRGAVDGLNVVVPFGEKRYYELRPTLAIPAPAGGANSAIDLDGFFGLHPALAPLKPIYDARRLAIVDAVGSPDPTRSHFDAQDYMESGTPGLKATTDGWMNRALPKAAMKTSPVRAIGLGSSLPRSLRGRNAAVAIDNLKEFQIKDASGSASFETMYNATLDTLLHGAGKDTFEAVKMLQAIQKQSYTPEGGAQYPKGRFGQSLLQIARLIRAGAGLQVAFADVGGWDTHVNQSAGPPAQGQLANHLAEFGQALAAFYQDLGDRMEHVTVVTMSEFGRAAQENGNRGTDHGHANVMFVMGGDVRGGKIYGEWPGLQEEQLYDGRDLNLTTDFRDVLGELVVRQLDNPNLKAVFPGYASPHFLGLIG